MKLTDLMNNYSPVYPSSKEWADAFKVLEEDSVEKNIVDSLIEEYRREGKFREPVILSTSQEDAYSEDEEDYEPYFPFVKDGTHRVYAHYLMQEEEVYVQEGYQLPNHEDVESEDYNIYPQMETYIKVLGEVADEELDDIFSTLRSFKLDEQTWMNANVLCWIDNIINVSWVNVLLDEEQQTQLNAKLAERFNMVAANRETITQTTVYFSEEEDDAGWNKFRKEYR